MEATTSTEGRGLSLLQAPYCHDLRPKGLHTPSWSAEPDHRLPSYILGRNDRRLPHRLLKAEVSFTAFLHSLIQIRKRTTFFFNRVALCSPEWLRSHYIYCVDEAGPESQGSAHLCLKNAGTESDHHHARMLPHLTLTFFASCLCLNSILLCFDSTSLCPFIPASITVCQGYCCSKHSHSLL